MEVSCLSVCLFLSILAAVCGVVGLYVYHTWRQNSFTACWPCSQLCSTSLCWTNFAAHCRHGDRQTFHQNYALVSTSVGVGWSLLWFSSGFLFLVGAKLLICFSVTKTACVQACNSLQHCSGSFCFTLPLYVKESLSAVVCLLTRTCMRAHANSVSCNRNFSLGSKHQLTFCHHRSTIRWFWQLCFCFVY